MTTLEWTLRLHQWAESNGACQAGKDCILNYEDVSNDFPSFWMEDVTDPEWIAWCMSYVQISASTVLDCAFRIVACHVPNEGQMALLRNMRQRRGFPKFKPTSTEVIQWPMLCSLLRESESSSARLGYHLLKILKAYPPTIVKTFQLPGQMLESLGVEGITAIMDAANIRCSREGLEERFADYIASLNLKPLFQ